MNKITIGQPVPEFELPATGDKTIRLSDLRGSILVLYFYPKASTPGCTQEGRDFSNAISQFHHQSAVVLGVSRDSIGAQEKFKARQAFPFDLLSDQEERLCQAFDVIKMKNMYGKQVKGIERSTFLIDAEGILQQEWRKVKVAGHVDAVLEAVKRLARSKS